MDSSRPDGGRPPLLSAFAAVVCSLGSVGAVLAQLYGIVPMHVFALVVSLPTMLALVGLSFTNAELGRRIALGAWAGLIATAAYDLIRIPFAASGYYVFKGMPAFGIWLVNGAFDTLTGDALGWLYHLSNGATFGVAYAVVAARRLWAWGVFFGIGLEGVLLLTPFGRTFEISLDARVLMISLAGHVIFGAVLGLLVQFPKMIRPGALSLAAMAALAVVLGAHLARVDRPAPAAPASVAVMADRVVPNWIRVRQGEPVRWINTLDEPVEVWSKHQFDSLKIPPRSEACFAFPNAVVCEYYVRGRIGIEGYAIVEPAR